MYERLEQAQDPEDPDPKMRTVYTDKYSVDDLEKIVVESLKRRDTTVATESMKQKLLQSLGTLRRKTSESVRYTLTANAFVPISTKMRQGDSVSAAELRSNKTYFSTDQTRESLYENQIEFFDEASEPGSGYKVVQIANRHDFKTPLNRVIAESDNERRFVNGLLRPENLSHYDAWIKSTAIRYYEIDFAWKKGEHPKRGKFSPDFFIYALAHFVRVNERLEKNGSARRYRFNFLTQKSFNLFFQALRQGNVASFRSEMDVKLTDAS